MNLKLDLGRYREDHGAIRSQPHGVERESLAMINQFTGHTLEEQAAVHLADRTDSKFLMPVTALPLLLESLGENFSVLDTSGHRVFTYENTYFDSPGWHLYLSHHNGKLNRYKYRLRRYRENNVAYFETKLKTNKNRTVKERVSCSNDNELEVQLDNGVSQPSLYVNYRRISLWDHSTDERITLDYDLHYRRPSSEKVFSLGRLLIVEIKREGRANGSPFVKRAKTYGLTPENFSKYCVGVCLTDDGSLKRNRFKSVLEKVNEICNERGELMA